MANDNAQLINVLVPLVAIAVTGVATWFVTRRGAGSTFTAELLKENTYIRERNKDLEAQVKEFEQENRRLSRENLEMYRALMEGRYGGKADG